MVGISPLRELRESLRLSQDVFCAVAGIADILTLESLEQGRAAISTEVLTNLRHAGLVRDLTEFGDLQIQFLESKAAVRCYAEANGTTVAALTDAQRITALEEDAERRRPEVRYLYER